MTALTLFALLLKIQKKAYQRRFDQKPFFPSSSNQIFSDTLKKNNALNRYAIFPKSIPVITGTEKTVPTEYKLLFHRIIVQVMCPPGDSPAASNRLKDRRRAAPFATERSIRRVVVVCLRLDRFFTPRFLFVQSFATAAVRHLAAGELLRRDATEVAAVAMNQPERIGVQETFA